MAGIDYIYGNLAQYILLKDWLEKNYPEALSHIYEPPVIGIARIALFTVKEDAEIYTRNPPLFVKERMEQQYGSSLARLLLDRTL